MEPSCHHDPFESESASWLMDGAPHSAVERYVNSLPASPPYSAARLSDTNMAGAFETMALYRSAVERLARLPSPGSGDSSSSRSPLHMNLGFLKNLTEKKSTRDGQTPKRRGPKPDSKPALTRRQELNRQAQRTHRERKELYVKALEQEVLRLKETVGITSREKNAIAEENRRLKELLRQHGIAYPGGEGDVGNLGVGDVADSLSRSMSLSMGASPDFNSPSASGGNQAGGIGGSPYGVQMPTPPQQNLDYDQVGIDFVLTLERPCMEHMQTLLVQAQQPEGDPSGHVLLASCPPASFLEETPEVPYSYDAVDLRRPELATLMDLSKRLQLDGEITPVMAWAMILSHERLRELTPKDFVTLKTDLRGKSRCYGFGAVVEEFEVRDALSSVFATKIETYNVFT